MQLLMSKLRQLKPLVIAMLLTLGVLLIAVSPSVSAQIGGEELPEGVSGDDVYRVSSEMYCAVCEGVPISACPTQTCFRWRQEVANLLGEGYTDTEIKSYFAERYGGEVTGVPIDDDQRNIVLGLPIILALVAGVLVVWQIIRLRPQGLTRAQEAARSAETLAEYDRPVPNNVDRDYLERFFDVTG